MHYRWATAVTGHNRKPHGNLRGALTRMGCGGRLKEVGAFMRIEGNSHRCRNHAAAGNKR